MSIRREDNDEHVLAASEPFAGEREVFLTAGSDDEMSHVHTVDPRVDAPLAVRHVGLSDLPTLEGKVVNGYSHGRLKAAEMVDTRAGPLHEVTAVQRPEMSGMSKKLATFDSQASRFTILDELSEKETEQATSAIECFHRFDTDQHLFLVTQLNYEEMVAAWEEHARKREMGTMGIVHLLNMRLDMNRRLLNLLASFRGFLDQTDAELKRRYGDGSEERSTFKDETSRQYDENHAYRLLYHIRHFAQHYSIAIDWIHSSAVIEEGVRKTALSMCFGRDALLNSGFDWNAAIRDEMAAGPETIEVMPLVHALKSSLFALGVKRVEIESPAALDALRILGPLAEKAMHEAPGYPCLVPSNFWNEGEIELSLDWFPMEAMSRLSAALR